MIIEKASNKEIELLKDANFKHPENIRASLDHDAIAHILKRHGVNSVNVKNNGEIPITNEDIANYRYIVNNADAILRTLDKYDKEAITAFKQINGYAVVVEQAINKKNELALKTMYKNNGSYKNNEVYKEFSSTSLDADAKVRHRLSSYSGAIENNTPKPLTSQEDLLKTSENLNENTQKTTQTPLSPLEQAKAEKLLKLQHAITPLKEFGKNYPEFALKPKEALEKLLQEKNGQVAGAAFREDLGGIDFVWGKDGKSGYGLAHIIESREKQYTRLGLNAEQIKERTDELLKSIPEVIENGTLLKDDLGCVSIQLNDVKVGLTNQWFGNDLKNHLIVTSYERDEKVLRELETRSPLSNDYKGNSNYSALNLNEDNTTQKPLSSQEELLKTRENLNETTQEAKNLSPLEQAEAEKLAKLKHAITPLKEFGKNYPEFALKPKEALEKLLQEKNGQVAGAAFRDDLGGIDFVWGNKDYGLEHILKRREEQAIAKGLNETEAKEYALNVVKSIPEIIEKGVKVDNNGRIAIEYKHMRVGLNDKWDNQKLENKWVISSYEIYNSESGLPFRPIAQLQEVGLEPSKLTEPNTTTNALKNQDLSPLELAKAEKLAKLQHAITPLKEFGKNYPEFALKPKEALEKLLQEKNGQVAGAAFREDLGGIDFVWGTPKTKDSNGYGLAHILERRISNEMKKGLSETEAKEYALNIIKSIPEVLEKGSKGTDHLGRVFVDYGNKRVGLNNEWKKEKLENHWVISSYELYDTEKQALRSTPQAITKEEAFNSLNSVEPNPTTNPLKTQDLSLLEQANAEKLAKLESE
ncbi:DUF3519 domain-containing protein, partial [Helicobacter pylori]